MRAPGGRTRVPARRAEVRGEGARGAAGVLVPVCEGQRGRRAEGIRRETERGERRAHRRLTRCGGRERKAGWMRRAWTTC